jgi:hypothetical protein
MWKSRLSIGFPEAVTALALFHPVPRQGGTAALSCPALLSSPFSSVLLSFTGLPSRDHELHSREHLQVGLGKPGIALPMAAAPWGQESAAE